MRERCVWTGERSDELVPVTVTTLGRFGVRSHEATFFVQPQYEAAFRDVHAFFVRHARTFLKGIGVYMVAVLLTSVLLVAGVLGEDTGLVVIGAATVALGVGTYRFPFATPETVAMFGLRRSIALARGGGALVALVGVAAMLLPVVA